MLRNQLRHKMPRPLWLGFTPCMEARACWRGQGRGLGRIEPADEDPARNPRLVRRARLGHPARGRRARRVSARTADGPRERTWRRSRGAADSPYRNTIPPETQAPFPGDLELEERITAIMRWNALAMVMRANMAAGELGGHIATYASGAEIFEVGFNHFFRAGGRGGDIVYFQPHSAPGVYARAFLEGRLSEDHLSRYRRETGGGGLSSYPHPWLMPGFWQTPTGSMGIGPISAIYQARFLRYLMNRGLMDTRGRRVWGVFGDGEMDEPESLAGLSLAGREGLDNLTFVINCNLQRLDGPVRSNGQIIQELERTFRAAGWRGDQGPVGIGLGSAVRARQAPRPHSPVRGDRRRQVPDARRQGPRIQSRPLLQGGRGPARAGRANVAARDRRAEAGRSRHSQAPCGVRRGDGDDRKADRDPRQDQEGLRHGRRRAVAHDRPPGEEARHRRR